MAKRLNHSPVFSKDLSSGQRLATQLLDALHRVEVAILNGRALNGDELDLSNPNVDGKRRLPVDKASYAIRLGYGLVPNFSTIKDLASTKAIVLIRAAETDDASVVGRVFADAVQSVVRRVAVNPAYDLRKEDDFLVVTVTGGHQLHGIIGACAQAAERCVPVFAIVQCGVGVPGLFSGSDFDLELPPLNNEMLELLVSVTHGATPSGLAPFRSAELLHTEDLVAHIRRGRPAIKCLSSLQQAVDRRAPKARPVGPKALLQDLAGYGEAKTWGMELAADFKLWSNGSLTWEEVDHRAVVLVGSPGTGKTTFAGVLAESLRVPLIGSSVAEWNGHDNLSGTLRRMQAVFDEAVSKSPCVLFLDELDGISNRSTLEGRHLEYWTQVINRMLELVTSAQRTEGLVIVGATNHVERIDPALLRSGRLDQIIRIPVPDAEALTSILKGYLGTAASVGDLQALAQRLVGSTGADIERLVRAAKAKARRAGRPFSLFEFEAMVVDPLDGLAPHTRRRIAVYEAGQRIVSQVLGLAEMSVGQRDGDLRKLLVKGLAEERFPTEETCNDVLAAIMAGRAAEEIVFGDVSIYGAGSDKSDLALATSISTAIELRTGFGEVGLIYVGAVDQLNAPPASSVGSIRRRIEAAMARASALLLDNREELESCGRVAAGGRSAAYLRMLN